MTEVRNGHWATAQGREFPVRQIKGDRWREIRDGKLVEPEHRAADFDTLVMVRTQGRLAGQDFEVTSAPGDEVDIYAITVAEDVREVLGLAGDPYSGWSARVPVDHVDGLHEVVTTSRAPGGSR